MILHELGYTIALILRVRTICEFKKKQIKMIQVDNLIKTLLNFVTYYSMSPKHLLLQPSTQPQFMQHDRKDCTCKQKTIFVLTSDERSAQKLIIDYPSIIEALSMEKLFHFYAFLSAEIMCFHFNRDSEDFFFQNI